MGNANITISLSSYPWILFANHFSGRRSARFQTLLYPHLSFIQPKDKWMIPFINSFNRNQPFQVSLDILRQATLAVVPAASNGKMEPAASQDITPLFDPLGFILAGSRVTQVPAMAPTTRATPETACDPSPQPNLIISMLMNLLSSLANPLEKLLGACDRDDTGPSTNSKIKPTRQFSSTPLAQPPQMNRLCILLFPSRAKALTFAVYQMTLSFVPVPPSLDPLSSVDHSLSLMFALSRAIQRL